MTFQEFVQNGSLEWLATHFPPQQPGSESLLDGLGYPITRLPVNYPDSAAFWYRVGEVIANGIVAGFDLDHLMERARSSISGHRAEPIKSPVLSCYRVTTEYGGAGSAFYIGQGHFLTCAHVVYEKGECTLSGGPDELQDMKCEVKIARTFANDPPEDWGNRDLALLEVGSDIENLIAIPFLTGWKRAHEKSIDRYFEQGLVGFHGYSSGGPCCDYPAKSKPFFGYEQDQVSDLQMMGGIPEGMSGGPLLLHGKTMICLGIARLGGGTSSTSRIISANKVLEQLKRWHIEPETLPADDLLFG